MLVHIDAGHGQCIRTQVGPHHPHIGPCHRGQHGQAAVAGTQVQHLVGIRSQPDIDAALGQHLGNQAARNDDPLVHIERHTLQPGFAGEVGRRLAGGDAFFKKSGHLRLLIRGNGVMLRCICCIVVGVQWRIQGQAQLPECEPGGFIEGIGGAVAECHTGLFELLCVVVDQFCQGHGLGWVVAATGWCGAARWVRLSVFWLRLLPRHKPVVSVRA